MGSAIASTTPTRERRGPQSPTRRRPPRASSVPARPSRGRHSGEERERPRRKRRGRERPRRGPLANIARACARCVRGTPSQQPARGGLERAASTPPATAPLPRSMLGADAIEEAPRVANARSNVQGGARGNSRILSADRFTAIVRTPTRADAAALRELGAGVRMMTMRPSTHAECSRQRAARGSECRHGDGKRGGE